MHASRPGILEDEAEDCCEFKPSWGYRMSTRPTIVTEKGPLESHSSPGGRGGGGEGGGEREALCRFRPPDRMLGCSCPRIAQALLCREWIPVEAKL